MKPAIDLRDIEEDDLSAVAAVHVQAFPKSAITQLGLEAARRYYAWQLTGPHECIARGAWIDDRLVGFCFGGTFRGSLSGFLRANRTFLVRRVLSRPHLLASPFFRSRVREGLGVLRRFSGAPRSRSSEAKVVGEHSFGILSIAVAPGMQGCGVGQALMAAAEAAARLSACRRMHLTVSPDNARALRFYEALGWERSGGAEGWTGRMTKDLQE